MPVAAGNSGPQEQLQAGGPEESPSRWAGASRGGTEVGCRAAGGERGRLRTCGPHLPAVPSCSRASARAQPSEKDCQHFQEQLPNSAPPGLSSWNVQASLWALSPAVAVAEVAETTHSLILTSGTLAPMESFGSELGVSFQVQLEAPHVVDTKRQVRLKSLNGLA